MTDIEVRPVAPEDVAAVVTLARDIWHLHYPGIITPAQIDYMLDQRYQPTRVLDELAQPDIWWDQAFLGTARVGFASCHFLPASAEMKLDKLYVHPSAQRQGVGQALTRAVVAHGRAQGATTLMLAVNKHNAGAIAAYERSGFSIREAVCADIGDGFVMDDFIMTRPL
jgi:ribosomal protein S18 acetylase RimI-like enzyme